MYFPCFTDRQVEQELRDKVKELESEVKSLKTKLDELRKAKNTTLIKKEKEFVSTGVPQRQSNVDPSSNVNKEELERSLKAKYQKQIDEVYEMNNIKFGVVCACVEQAGYFLHSTLFQPINVQTRCCYCIL